MGLMVKLDGTSVGLMATDWTKRKFQPGQAVKCISVDNETTGCAPLLESWKVYHVAQCNTAKECKFLFPEADYWRANGGRVVLEEMPNLEFSANRFKAL